MHISDRFAAAASVLHLAFLTAEMTISLMRANICMDTEPGELPLPMFLFYTAFAHATFLMVTMTSRGLKIALPLVSLVYISFSVGWMMYGMTLFARTNKCLDDHPQFNAEFFCVYVLDFLTILFLETFVLLTAPGLDDSPKGADEANLAELGRSAETAREVKESPGGGSGNGNACGDSASGGSAGDISESGGSWNDDLRGDLRSVDEEARGVTKTEESEAIEEVPRIEVRGIRWYDRGSLNIPWPQVDAGVELPELPGTTVQDANRGD